MKESIKSLTDKRIIVQATMCGKEINLLVDTGASVGIISENVKGIKYGRRYNGTDAWNVWSSKTVLEFV